MQIFIVFFSVFTTLVRFRTTFALRLEQCDVRALGMENGQITDSQITASSSFDKQSVGPQNARLNFEYASGAWCPKPQINSKSYEFLQINLNQTFLITAIETQGRYGNGTGREFASAYMIDYFRNGNGGQWIRYKNREGNTLIPANTDTTTIVKNQLDPPIVATKIRIVPTSKAARTICLRSELLGCEYHDVVYYTTVPDGSRLDSLDFKDSIFEDTQTFTESGIKRGLGLLTDGLIAQSSPFDQEPKNATWIGWNRETTDGAVTLLFEFEEVHNFSDVVLATYGNRIDQIDVIFSQDGKNFPLNSQISSSERQTANNTARRYDFRVPLHNRCGKKVRVSIKFSSEWMFLTEVNFNSALNQSAVVIKVTPASSVFTQKILVSFGVLFLILLFCLSYCLLWCMRKRKEKSRKNYDQKLKKDLIITHMGNKPACHVFPKTSSGPYEVANDIYYAKSHKSTLLSVSSKSSSSYRQVPPTWNDFNFPPPPNEITGAVYCQPISPENSSSSDSTKSSSSGRNIKKYPSSTLMLGPTVGEGKFTKIRECIVLGGLSVAHKSLKDVNCLHGRRALTDEITMLKKCGKHPNIVELVAIDEHHNLLLEYMDMGTIRTFLQSAPTPLDRGILPLICREVCRGMAYLESIGVVHGHLTPNNILIQNDFDVKISAPRGPNHHAQLRYSSPESILNNDFTHKSDIWSFSACVWEMAYLCRTRPYEHLTNEQIVDNASAILESHPDAEILQFPTIFETGTLQLLGDCFEVIPADRPSFEDFLKVFKL